jgi:hypothetical protein
MVSSLHNRDAADVRKSSPGNNCQKTQFLAGQVTQKPEKPPIFEKTSSIRKWLSQSSQNRSQIALQRFSANSYFFV